MESKTPQVHLTVVIADDSPLIFCNDPPTHRTVRIALSASQLDRLRLMRTGTRGTNAVYERISTAYLEEPTDD